jgi:hypothetical protein
VLCSGGSLPRLGRDAVVNSVLDAGRRSALPDASRVSFPLNFAASFENQSHGNAANFRQCDPLHLALDVAVLDQARHRV